MAPILLSSLCAAGLGASAPAAPLTLVRDGKPVSAIVLADTPTAAARQGADQLQAWLRKASGATVPIRAEIEIGAEPPETLILLGDTRRTAALGLRSSDFALEE